MTHSTKKFLGLKDENIILAKDWLEKYTVREKTHIIIASLIDQPKVCLKCELVTKWEIVENGPCDLSTTHSLPRLTDNFKIEKT